MNLSATPFPPSASCRRLLLAGALVVPLAAAAADEALVARGEYLATAADCAGCHTREGGEPFAGGRAIESPLGTLYTSNITTDPEHGIGRWSEADFRRALREGRDEEGHYLYPAMPYTAYTRISDEDIAALWAWQRTLAPSSDEPPENEMIFPANLREGLALWQAVEFDPGRFEPAGDRDATYNRGAYLVEALGHCSACHTPRDPMLGEDASRAYTGAEIHGWYAPAIGPGALSDIGDWSVEDLATFLGTGENARNEKAVGEMATVVHESLSKLTEEDLHAMATYLKEMPPAAARTVRRTSEALSPRRLEAGRALYAGNCLSCHQADGRGVERAVPSLVDNGTVTGREADTLITMMLEGHPDDGTWAAMPSFARELTSENLADIANYVRTAWGNEGEPDVSFEDVNAARKTATLPPGGQQPGIDCPVLSGTLIEPALAVPLDAFEAAREDGARAAELVAGYRAARADSSTEDTVLALSSAYCRALGTGNLGRAEQQGRVAALAGRVAEAADASGR